MSSINLRSAYWSSPFRVWICYTHYYYLLCQSTLSDVDKTILSRGTFRSMFLDFQVSSQSVSPHCYLKQCMWFSTFEITPTQFKFVHYYIYTAFYCSTIQGDVLSLRLNLLQHRFGTIPTSSSLTKVEHEF